MKFSVIIYCNIYEFIVFDFSFKCLFSRTNSAGHMVLANKRENIVLNLYYNTMVKTMFWMKRNNWLQYLIYLKFKSALGDQSHFLSISRPN